MTISRTQLILFAVLVVAVLVVGVVLGRGCAGPAPAPAPLDPGGIDAGPGEAVIAGTLDGAVQAGQVQIAQIEDKFGDDMAAFDEQQRAQYAQLRGSSVEDAARYLSEWSLRRRGDAGT